MMDGTSVCESPFPARKAPCVDTVEREGQNTTDHGAEIPENGDQDYAFSKLIGPVPVAKLQKYAWP
jgi:hypothetical protein